jgi:hypothetical protein
MKPDAMRHAAKGIMSNGEDVGTLSLGAAPPSKASGMLAMITKPPNANEAKRTA